MSVLIALALFVLPQAPPTAAEPVTIRLLSSPKKGAGELRFDGKAQFPAGIALKGTLFRLDERLVAGRLVQEPTEIASDVATVEGKRVAFTLGVKESGVYRLVIEYREDLQEPDLLVSFKKPVPGKWSFDHAVWGDDFTGSLSARIRDFDRQAEQAIDLIRRFSAATASSQVWKDQYPALDKELAVYLRKFDQAAVEKLYPAAGGELRCTMRNLKGNAEAILFGDDGKCKGSIDYRTQKPTKTIHSADFTFDAILKDVEAGKRSAGTEYLLWLIKDFRRAGPRPALSDALRSEAGRPGIAPFVESLEGFKDLEATEKLLRECPKG